MANDTILELQKHEHDCGPASIIAALKLNGIKAKYKEVYTLAGTTPETGTLGEGVVRALVNYGFHAHVWNTKRLVDIRKHMNKRPMILSLDRGNHWVLLVSVYKNNAVVFDPYVGTFITSIKNLTKRWRHTDGCLYAIDVGLE